MQSARLSLAAALLLASCAPALPPPGDRPTAAIQLTAAQKQAIGRQIWRNEAGGTVRGLTAWNVGEEFPSLGIGHFIWYPENFRGPFEESWPRFVAYARERGERPPAIATRRHSPWRSREQFQREFDGQAMSELRQWLADHVEIQTDFIILRSRAALPQILAAAPAVERARIEANYRKVAATPHGTYALIDYVNFKGEGTKATERYRGEGWGLLQVLQDMREVPAGQPAAAEFSAAAKRVLDRRIAHSPAERGEARWRQGWHNRCDTYARPL